MDHLKFQKSSMSYPNSGRYVSHQYGPVPVTGPVSAAIPMQVWNNNVRSVHGSNSGIVPNVKLTKPPAADSAMPVKTSHSSSQTDFPKEIADLHLKELPNTLFINKNNSQTETSIFNNGNVKQFVLNKRQDNLPQNLNVISSGTHPFSRQNRDSRKETPSSTKPVKKLPKQSGDHDNESFSSEDEGKAAENSNITKKKRKRNRKKKKPNVSETNDENPPQVNIPISEMNIHLEDEFEFPDLSGRKRSGASSAVINGAQEADSINSVNTLQNIQHLNGSSEKENYFGLESVTFDSENSDKLLFKQIGETKSARKGRKRRDQANKAANEEMAEITIERQLLLQELGLKAKQDVQSTVVKESSTPAPKQTKASKNNRKSNQPIALDFAAMIDALEQKRDNAITTKNAPKKAFVRRKAKPPELEPPRRPHNPLDSTCPKVKRGKEREFPKPKKPSPLKKVILKEREEKKRMRLLDDDPSVAGGGNQVCVGVVNPESDFSQDEEKIKGSASAELSPVSQTSPFSMSPLSPSASPLHSGFNSPIAKDSSNPALLKIHSRRYREYCTQILDKDIDNCCHQFLQNLVRSQDKQYHKDPKKAKAKRRIVLGLREVAKHLKWQNIKCVIISPNLEKIQSKGGLDDALNNILNMCTEQEVPYVFALGRRALGRACAKLVPVSVVGVFNFDGSERQFWRLIELTQKATDSYKEMVSVVEKDLQENPTNRIGPANVPILFAHMGHSRTPSGCSAISFTSSILSEPISENYPYSEPETDSKGYKVSRTGRGHIKGIQSSVINEKSSSAIYETDAGNEADTEDYLEPVESAKNHLPFSNNLSTNNNEDDDEEDDTDNIEDLPHIDSIHYGSYDLSVEILSQHSSRTIENSEAMSTHSSRTLRDGSPTMLLDKFNEKHNVVGTLATPHKIIDKDRIQSWVEATQSCTDDSCVDGSADETTVQQVDGDGNHSDSSPIMDKEDASVN